MTEECLNEILIKVRNIYEDEYSDKLKKLYLYGSYARGDNKEYSDIDIAGIVDGDRKTLQDQLHTIWSKTAPLLGEYDVIVSPTVIPYEEFEDYKSVLPYYRNIIVDGKEI